MDVKRGDIHYNDTLCEYILHYMKKGRQFAKFGKYGNVRYFINKYDISRDDWNSIIV